MARVVGDAPEPNRACLTALNANCVLRQVSTFDVENQLRDRFSRRPDMTSSASYEPTFPQLIVFLFRRRKETKNVTHVSGLICYRSFRPRRFMTSPCWSGNGRASRLHARGAGNFEGHDHFPVGVDGVMADGVSDEVVAHTLPDYPKIIEGGQSFPHREDAILYVAT